MTDSLKLASIEAARAEFPEAVIPTKTNGRFEYIKNKTSQAVKSRSNVVIIKDNETTTKDGKGVDVTAKYVIAVNISTNEAGSDQNLEALQAVVTEFLNSIQSNIQ